MEDRHLVFSQNLDRLISEHRKYGKLIVAYDFDNTVYDYHGVGDTFPKVIELIRKCRQFGFYLIVFTSCGPEKYDFIKNYLNENDIPFDSINENAPFTKFNGGKVYYNILLDDRAGLRDSYLLLSYLFSSYNEEEDPYNLTNF